MGRRENEFMYLDIMCVDQVKAIMKTDNSYFSSRILEMKNLSIEITEFFSHSRYDVNDCQKGENLSSH